MHTLDTSHATMPRKGEFLWHTKRLVFSVHRLLQHLTNELSTVVVLVFMKIKAAFKVRLLFRAANAGRSLKLTIAELIGRAGAWLVSFVLRRAGILSGGARWVEKEKTNMAMLKSGFQTIPNCNNAKDQTVISKSIVLFLRLISVGTLKRMKTFITSMASEMTIELKTLSFGQKLSQQVRGILTFDRKTKHFGESWKSLMAC